MYMLVRNGNIQLVPLNLSGVEVLGIPLASDHEQATALAAFYCKRSDGVRPALIGSIPGESIQTVISYAKRFGFAIALLIGWQGEFPVIQPFSMKGTR